MSLGSIFRRVIPVAAAAATGGPLAAFTTTVALGQQNKEEKAIKRQIAAQNEQIQQENRRMAEIFGTGNISSVQAPLGGSAVTRSGFGSGFGTFLGDVGRNIVSPISSIATAISPFFSSRDNFRQPATTRRPILMGMETQTTGQNEAFIGGLPSAFGAASRFLGSRAGQIGTAVGVGGALTSALMPEGKMRITKKTKRLAQQAYSLAMGDLGTAVGLLAQLSGLAVDEQTYVLILTKRFRNDGPVITKAALRKTKTTLRRMKNMCDMYDSLRKAPTRRKTPMRRASTTLISNK